MNVDDEGDEYCSPTMKCRDAKLAPENLPYGKPDLSRKHVIYGQ